MQPRWGWPGRRPVAMAFALGLGIALGHVPFGLWPLSLLALAVLLHLLARATMAHAFWLALFAGAGHFALALSWIVQPFFVDPWRHGWLAPFALLGLSFGLALFWAGAAALAARCRWPLVALVLAFALADLARGHVLTGFPWALFGYLMLDTPVEQAAALIGGYGLGLCLLALAALPAARPVPGAALTACLLAGLWFWGSARQEAPVPDALAATVRIVQPNIEQIAKWDPDIARANFDRLLDLTALPPAGPAPVLAIWPETAVPFLLRQGDAVSQAIGDQPMPVAAGFQRVESDDRAWNSVAVFGPGGTITQSYDKVHLVPFGEYMPAGDLLYQTLGIRAFAAQQGAGYTAGAEARLMDLGPALGLARPLICYEAIFPAEIATGTRPGWLMQVTNDAWFGTLTGPYQHFAMARLRAIEQGLPLVRAANTGISAVVNARGRIAVDVSGAPALLPLGVPGIIDAALPAALSPPPYARIGDLPLLMLLLAGLGCCLLLGRNLGKA